MPEPAASRNPQQLIIQGLLHRERMRPIQALVLMALYQQYPERYLPNNDFFFLPSEKQVTKALKLKAPVYYLMLTRLVDGGWLDRRKGPFGMEYRIVFAKLHPFIEQDFNGG